MAWRPCSVLARLGKRDFQILYSIIPICWLISTLISFSVQLAKKKPHPKGWGFFLVAKAELVMWPPGYETDERSSLGHEPERCRWQMQRGRSECRGRWATQPLKSARRAPGTANGEIRRRNPCKCLSQSQNRVLPTQPTLRTEKDIGSKNPETAVVSGFFRAIFQGAI